MKRDELRKYLLGELSEDPADQLDACLFSGDDLHRDLQDELDVLIEELVAGRLTEEEEASFRAQIARSPALKEKVDSFRFLQAALERQADRIVNAAPTWFSRFATLASPALAFLLCVAVFLNIRGERTNANLSSQLQALSSTTKTAASPIGGSSVAIAFLSAEVPRGPIGPPEIPAPATASLLELQIEIHQPPPEEDAWNAEVLRGTEVVWKSSHIPLHRIGHEEFLALFIDAGDIPPGSYVVHYAPASPAATAQARSFRVVEHR